MESAVSLRNRFGFSVFDCVGFGNLTVLGGSRCHTSGVEFLISISASDTYDWMKNICIFLGRIQSVESLFLHNIWDYLYASMRTHIRTVIYGTFAVMFVVSFIRWYSNRCFWATFIVV